MTTSSRFGHWPPPSGELVTLRLRVPPAKIGLVCSTLEAYEGVAVVRTADREAGLIDMWIMPGQRDVVESVLAELEKRFRILRLGVADGHVGLSAERAR